MTTVLVTGASGFIAKHIVCELLENSHDVKASVRSDKGQAQVGALFPNANIEFVRLDLNSDAGWDDAMNGVDVLMHTASPFPLAQPKDPEELIRPAVDGTKRALNAASKAGVNRVILTSSCAAIYKDSSKPKGEPSTRDNWTDPDGPATSPYEASKTLAEKAAWDIATANPSMQLTTINPGAVFGAPMDEHYGTSLEIVDTILSGGMPMVPRAVMPAVDVRDVARMHVKAISTPVSIGKRYPANVGAEPFLAFAEWLKDAYPDKKISTRLAPNWLLKLMGIFNGDAKQMADALGLNLDVDGSDAERDFGFVYIPVKEALLASADVIVNSKKA